MDDISIFTYHIYKHIFKIYINTNTKHTKELIYTLFQKSSCLCMCMCISLCFGINTKIHTNTLI